MPPKLAREEETNRKCTENKKDPYKPTPCNQLTDDSTLLSNWLGSVWSFTDPRIQEKWFWMDEWTKNGILRCITRLRVERKRDLFVTYNSCEKSTCNLFSSCFLLKLPVYTFSLSCWVPEICMQIGVFYALGALSHISIYGMELWIVINAYMERRFIDNNYLDSHLQLQRVNLVWKLGKFAGEIHSLLNEVLGYSYLAGIQSIRWTAPD